MTKQIEIVHNKKYMLSLSVDISKITNLFACGISINSNEHSGCYKFYYLTISIIFFKITLACTIGNFNDNGN